MFKNLKDLEDRVINTNTFNTSKQNNKSKLIGGTVCKYWLEKRCKKGENCEFLHENIKEKLPTVKINIIFSSLHQFNSKYDFSIYHCVLQYIIQFCHICLIIIKQFNKLVRVVKINAL